MKIKKNRILFFLLFYGRTTGIEPACGGFTIHCLGPLGYVRPGKTNQPNNSGRGISSEGRCFKWSRLRRQVRLYLLVTYSDSGNLDHWNEGSIKELEHAFIDAFTGTGWGVDLVHLYYPDLIVVKRDNKDQGIQLFQKWRQYLICIQHIKICNRFRLMNKYKCLSVNSKESLMQVNRNRIGRRQSIRVTYQIFNV